MEYLFIFWTILKTCSLPLHFFRSSPKTFISPGADPGFQVRGAHLNKLRRAEGGAKNFGVFRVKNHDFTPRNHIFSNFRGGGRRVRPPPPGSAPAHPPLSGPLLEFAPSPIQLPGPFPRCTVSICFVLVYILICYCRYM